MNSLKEIILNIKIPLLITFLFSIANSYFNSFISINLYDLNVNEFELSIVSNAFYFGIFLSSLFSVRYIQKLGYSKSFQISIILYFIAILFSIIYRNKFVWVFLRFISGWALSAVWIISESWILGKSNSANRGKMLSIYLLSLQIANAIGQLLLGVFTEYEKLGIVTILTIITISSIINFTVTHDDNIADTKAITGSQSVISLLIKNPFYILVIITAGAFVATLYSIMPYCFELMQFDQKYTSLLLFIIVSGGVVLQYPFGYLVDKIGKEKLLLGVFLAITIIASLITFIPAYTGIYLLCFFLFGGLISSLYLLGTNLICDSVTGVNFLKLAKILIILYAVGTMIGPFIAPIFIYKLGAKGVLWFFSCSSFIIFIYLSILMVIKFKQERIYKL